MPGRRGRATPGSCGLAAIGKKKRAAVLPPREDWNFFLGRIPTLARARQGSDAGQVARPGYAGKVRRNCRIRRQFRKKILGRIPTLGSAGAAGWRSAKPYDRMIRMTRRAGVSGAAGNRHQPPAWSSAWSSDADLPRTCSSDMCSDMLKLSAQARQRVPGTPLQRRIRAGVLLVHEEAVPLRERQDRQGAHMVAAAPSTPTQRATPSTSSRGTEAQRGQTWRR